MVLAAIRTIFAQPDAAAVSEQLDEIVAKLQPRFAVAAAMLAEAKADGTAFTAFPVGHWRKIWSTNPLERVNKEIKRRCSRLRRSTGLTPRGSAEVLHGGHGPRRNRQLGHDLAVGQPVAMSRETSK